ncbi:MAG: threonine synthase [Candidatus Bathyarchaeia archaeon]
MKALRCRECKATYPPGKMSTCPKCLGPLEVEYEYELIPRNPAKFIEKGFTDLWRYRKLLPLKGSSQIVSLHVGLTPLLKAQRLAEKLKLKTLYVKNDAINPTGSFKDRPVTVAVSKAIELGFKAVGCASTGNLAAATAAHAAKAHLPCYVFVPENLEPNKIAQTSIFGANIITVKGTYDQANRMAAEAADRNNIAILNVSIRSYYVEGSKTTSFEICEQLGWRAPDHVILPMASGALICSLNKGFQELVKVGLIEEKTPRLSGAQPAGCSPIIDALKRAGGEVIPVEEPKTIAKSLAIGEPGDGIYAVKTISQTRGCGEAVSDEELIEGIQLLAKTEGIFTEPAGGVTVAALKKMRENGEIEKDEDVVCYITGNGLKTPEAVTHSIQNALNRLKVA